MLSEYFAIDINAEGAVTALPELVQQYTPPLLALPSFLLRLVTEVDWNSEKGKAVCLCRCCRYG